MRNKWFSIFCLSFLRAWTLPLNPTVIAGEILFEEDFGRLLIRASDGAVIQWKEFSMEPGETIEFIQPGDRASVWNRVEENPSRLRGRLLGMGRIILINESGIRIGSETEVDVAEFIAATLDFRGNAFYETARGLVVNQGTIRANDVELIGYEVQNLGQISAWRIGLIGTRMAEVTDSSIRTNDEIEDSGKRPLKRFDCLKALDMPGPTATNHGSLIGETIYVLGDYVDLGKESKIQGKEIFIGGGEEILRNAQIVRINGKIEAQRIKAWSDAALIGRGEIKGRLEVQAPLLLDVFHD